MRLKIVNKSKNPLPGYETIYSSGMDLRADLGEAIILRTMERVLIPTGLFVELPRGYEAQIRPRSGLAIKSGISVLNSPGTIDADYRGEIKVIVINLSNEDFVINNGDRICQMVIQRTLQIEWEISEELSQTKRGSGGFGHTGSQ